MVVCLISMVGIVSMFEIIKYPILFSVVLLEEVDYTHLFYKCLLRVHLQYAQMKKPCLKSSNFVCIRSILISNWN